MENGFREEMGKKMEAENSTKNLPWDLREGPILGQSEHTNGSWISE